MRVEIIELLRCPANHEPSPLVTVAHARDGDRLSEGTLGCAVCGAEYPMKDGVVFLAVGRETRLSDAGVDGTRTAALLGLSAPGMRALLCGAYGGAAQEIARATGAVCVTVNASLAVLGVRMVDHLMIGAFVQVPLAGESLSGLAVDASHVALLGDAARVVRPGGRVLAPAHAPVPAGLQELARDDDEWVAVVEATVSSPFGLRRGNATS